MEYPLAFVGLRGVQSPRFVQTVLRCSGPRSHLSRVTSTVSVTGVGHPRRAENDKKSSAPAGERVWAAPTGRLKGR